MKYWRTILCASALGLGGLAVWAADSWKNNTTRRGAANALPLEAVASAACAEPPSTLQPPTVSEPSVYVQRTYEPSFAVELPAPPRIPEPLPSPRSTTTEIVVPVAANDLPDGKAFDSPAAPPKPELTPPVNLPEPPLPPAPPMNPITKPMLPSLPVPEMPAATDLTIPLPSPPTLTSAPIKTIPDTLTPLPGPEVQPPSPLPSKPPELTKKTSTGMNLSRSLRLSVRTGGAGAPRFEVRDGDILLLKVSCDNVEMQTSQGKDAVSPGIIATGNVRLHGSGLDGTCDYLTVVTANGEVMLKGNIKLTCYRAGSSSEVQADQMRFSLLRGDAAAKPRALSPIKPAGHTDR